MHTLHASPETCHWGYFDGTLKPVLTVPDGTVLRVECVSGAPVDLPPPGFHVPPELLAIHAALGPPTMGPHILTGPVAVEGAEPGDVLEVRILDVELRQDWGFNKNLPLLGTLPDDFPSAHQMNIALDAARGVARFPWGLEVPLRPFFGVLGVAPPPEWRRLTTVVPRAFGGNIDNRELVAGSTLFLPVFVPGALFSCGDGHGAQGDGEVNLTAIETALAGTFELIVRKDMHLDAPLAETPTHVITHGFDPDLDRAAENALRRMIAEIVARTELSRDEAYALVSIAGDLRITQLVNQHKGAHCMVSKSLLRQG
jgi:acetamidase/formamidase